jgi:cyclopropane fatty-acyl-phospholipid synthase-like methyltransferase
MTSYYRQRLSGRRLQRCYEVASPRVQQYLEAEIVHALERIRPADTVLELGCGYGRIALRVADVAHRVVGIDNATREPRIVCEDGFRVDGSSVVCEARKRVL